MWHVYPCPCLTVQYPSSSLGQDISCINTHNRTISEHLRGELIMSKVAVLIKNPEQQYEGLRSSLGMLLYNTEVQMFVLNDEIADMDEAYEDNMGFLDEMEGERFSNNKTNVEKYGFKYATIEQIGEMLREADLVIPF
jgi:hypothetical protein